MTRLIWIIAVAPVLLAPPATADDIHIWSPYDIDVHELEIEHNGAASFDHLPDNNGATAYTLEIGTGLTPWWETEIEFGFGREPGVNQPTLFTRIVTENIFQLTEPGEYFADFAFFLEYGQSMTAGRHAAANEVTFGPLIAKDTGPFTHTVNLFLTRELGPNQTTHGLDFSYAWQTRWNLWAPLSPAIEIYGDAGTLGRNPRLSQQGLRIGPVAIGSLRLNQLGLGHAGRLKYEPGWLFGATQATPQGTLRWRLEVEIPF